MENFITKNINIFNKQSLNLGRIISFSKSIYIKNNPNNVIIFNANVFDVMGNKIWFGDLNITLEENKLLSISRELGFDIFIVSEYNGRFGNEKKEISKLLEKSIWRSEIFFKPSFITKIINFFK